MRSPFFLALIAVLACPLSASASNNLSGLLDTGFAYSLAHDAANTDADQYFARMGLLYTFDNPGMAVQLNGSIVNLAANGAVTRPWSAGGDLFWRDDKGTFGVSISRETMDLPGSTLYGAREGVGSSGIFGEYYATDNLTLQIRGGGMLGGRTTTGYSGGVGLTFYDNPDLAFHTELGFSTFLAGRDWTDIESSLEYLPFRSFPIGFYAGYDWSSISNNGEVSTIFAGIRLHLSSGDTLVEIDRTGPVDWTGNAARRAMLKF